MLSNNFRAISTFYFIFPRFIFVPSSVFSDVDGRLFFFLFLMTVLIHFVVIKCKTGPIIFQFLLIQKHFGVFEVISNPCDTSPIIGSKDPVEKKQKR